MATISSLILNSDHVEGISAADNTLNNHELDINANNIAMTETSEESESAAIDLLAEIQAIKDAIVNAENFDFAALEAPAAGQADLSLGNDKSVSSSPILLSEDNLVLQYRSTDTSEIRTDGSETNSAFNTLSNNTSVFSEMNGDSQFLGDTSTQETNLIQSNLSEDLITEARGSFDTTSKVNAQTIETQYGRLVCNEDGTWNYTLNNQQSNVQSLSAGSSIEDTINLESTSGESIELSILINGSNDQAVITGQKQASVAALPLSEIGNIQPSVNGKLNVSDIDTGEARFDTNFSIKGSFGNAQINALGEWSYTLNNTSDAVQGLRSGEKIFDLFSVKTLDGSKQLIQISIEGVDDKPLLSGKNVAILDLETDISTLGTLTVNDPDFGESAFQVFSNIQSSLGYGSAEIDSQGNWSFALDSEFTSSNTIEAGQTRIDSFEVYTVDGTSLTVFIPIQGSNNPLYTQTDNNAAGAESLSLNELLSEHEQQDNLATLINSQSEQNEVSQSLGHNSGDSSEDNSGDSSSGGNHQLELSIYMNGDSSNLGQQLSQNLTDVPIT